MWLLEFDAYFEKRYLTRINQNAHAIFLIIKKKSCSTKRIYC